MRIGLILICLMCLNLNAQTSKILKESYVDSISYVYSINGQHTELVSIANQAFNKGIDFYFLRYRLGVSYFNQKKYLLANVHFRKALEYYPADFYTKEYLFYCNLYLNNVEDAKQIILMLPINFQSYYSNLIGNEKLLNIESGYQTTSYENSQNATTFLGIDGMYAESDRMKTLQYYQLGANFPVTKKFKLYTGFSYILNNRTRHIYSNDFYYIYDNQIYDYKKSVRLKDTVQDYNLKQFQTYIGTSINLKKRFTLQAGFQNMYYSQNKLIAKADSIKSTMLDTLIYNYRYQINENSLNNYVSSISLSKTYSTINVMLGIGYSRIDKTNIYQVGGQLTYSPLGNYNLNITGGNYISLDSKKRNVLFAKVAGKMTDVLWFEVYHYQGNLKYFHESNAYVVYNISDVIKSKSGINFAYYFHPNWTLNMRYDLLMRSATFTRYITSSQLSLVDNYLNNSFIINLLWKF